MNPAILEPSSIATKTQDPALASASFLRRISSSLTREPMELRDFYMQAWPIVEPSKPLVGTWLLDMMLEYLKAVALGQIKRLIFNVPPRHLKSDTVSVIWPSHVWTEEPWKRFIFSSYSASLAVKHSIDRRHIIESGWYQKNWGDTTAMEADQNQKAEFQNIQRGAMYATSVGGSITGKGADIIVCDDLINPEEAESKAHREAAINFYTRTLSTRLDDKKTGSIVVVEQRLHKADLTANILKEGGWTHVKVPAVAPTQTVVKFPLSDRTIVRPDGSVICEEREDKAILAQQKIVMGSRAFSAQYQQEPVSADSGYFHPSWWKFYKELPPMDQLERAARGWDTAVKTGQSNDYTAGCLIHKFPAMYYVDRNFFKQRIQYPDLKRRIILEAAARPASAEVVEDSSAGASVIQDLARETNLPIIPFIASKDKVTRASVVSPLVESGHVALPEGAPWVADFIDAMASFPDIEHDDDVDAFVIALMFLSGRTLKGAANLTVYQAGDSEEEDAQETDR